MKVMAMTRFDMFVRFSVLAVLLSGCKSDLEKFVDYKISEPSKVQYCVEKTKHYWNNSYNKVLRCIKKTSDQEVATHNQLKSRERESRRNAQALENMWTKQAKDREDRAAEEKLLLIQAKNRAYPESSLREIRKLKYCQTNPDWRKYGVLIAKELEVSRTSSTVLKAVTKPEFLRDSVVLQCFNSVSSNDVSAFFDLRVRETEELIGPPHQKKQSVE